MISRGKFYYFMHLKLRFKLNTLILNDCQNIYIYITKSKINPIFTGHIFRCSLSIQKVSYSKSNTTFISPTNPAGYSASLRNFFGDSPVSKQRTLPLVRKAVNYFSHYPRMKPWHFNKSHDFQTLVAIFCFFRTSVHTLVIKFPDKDASTFKFFRAYSISFDSGT